MDINKCIICKNKINNTKQPTKQPIKQPTDQPSYKDQVCHCCFLASNNTSTVFSELYEN